MEKYKQNMFAINKKGWINKMEFIGALNANILGLWKSNCRRSNYGLGTLTN
jgi:hypothetical protein